MINLWNYLTLHQILRRHSMVDRELTYFIILDGWRCNKLGTVHDRRRRVCWLWSGIRRRWAAGRKLNSFFFVCLWFVCWTSDQKEKASTLRTGDRGKHCLQGVQDSENDGRWNQLPDWKDQVNNLRDSCCFYLLVEFLFVSLNILTHACMDYTCVFVLLLCFPCYSRLCCPLLPFTQNWRRYNVRVSGGVARSDFLLSTLAALTEKTVCRPMEPETTILGVAMLTGVTIGKLFIDELPSGPVALTFSTQRPKPAVFDRTDYFQLLKLLPLPPWTWFSSW